MCAKLIMFFFPSISSIEVRIPARKRCLVPTDISMAIPEGTYGRISSKSGLSLHHGIEVGAGVIDSDFRGHIQVLMYNHSDQDYTVHEGDKIAQMIFHSIITPDLVEVDSLDATERGSKGFGLCTKLMDK